MIIFKVKEKPPGFDAGGCSGGQAFFTRKQADSIQFLKSCKSRNLCQTCQHFARIAVHGVGSVTFGIIPLGSKSLVFSDTLNSAVANPTESGFLSCPNFKAGHGLPKAAPTVYGQGGPSGNTGRAALFASLTPCPPVARSGASSGFKSHNGAEAMNKTTPKTGIYTNSVERHAAIENSLSTALHLVRHGTTTGDIQRALSRAMRATTLLKHTCEVTSTAGGAV